MPDDNVDAVVTEGMSDEDRGFVENKGWHQEGGQRKMFDSYKHLEQLQGVDASQVVRLPKDPEDPHQVREYFTKLGCPDDEKGYEIPETSNLPEGELDLMPIVSRNGHKYGLTKSQMSGFVKDVMGEVGEFANSRDQRTSEDSEMAMTELEREWGKEFQANLQYSATTSQTFKLSEEDMSDMEGALGTKKFMTLMANIGRAVSEDGFVDSDLPQEGSEFGMTPAAAKAKIKEMEGDPTFGKKLMSDNPAEKNIALEQRDRIYKIAYPEGA